MTQDPDQFFNNYVQNTNQQFSYHSQLYHPPPWVQWTQQQQHQHYGLT